MLRIYLLRNMTNFSNADFFSLYEKDRQVLSDALVWREEIMLTPGEVRRLDPIEAGEGKFLAVLAAFRDIDHARWQSSVQLIPDSKNDILVFAKENSVGITQGSDSSRLKSSMEKVDLDQIKKAEIPQVPQPPRITVPEKPSLPSRPSLW